MKKRFLLLLVLIAVPALYLTEVLLGDPMVDLPPLQSGDLVFQTSYTPQSLAVMWSSKSLYDHVGMVVREPDGVYVLEAGPIVEKTPLPQWVKRGKLQRVTVFRDPRLSTRERQQLVEAAETYLGKPYDYYFQFDTDAIYCSELIFQAYHALDKSVGQVQRVATLDVNNFLVEKLIMQRWKDHPLCKNKELTYQQCHAEIYNQRLITPASIARDARLEVVFDNYPF